MTIRSLNTWVEYFCDFIVYKGYQSKMHTLLSYLLLVLNCLVGMLFILDLLVHRYILVYTRETRIEASWGVTFTLELVINPSF
jgi:hypothetical protein